MFTNYLINNIAKLLVIAAVVSVSVPAASALSPDYYTGTSKLATGKWVKIKTEAAGIHEISYDQLRQWGFADPQRVNVYGYGATAMTGEEITELLPDDVKLTYTFHEGDKLYFYAGGDVDIAVTGYNTVSVARNYYTTDVYYLLSDRQPDASEMPRTVGYEATRPALDAHLTVQYVEDEAQHPTIGGAIFLGNDISKDAPYPVTFQVAGMGSGNSSWTASTFTLSFGAYCADRETGVSVITPSQVNDYTTTTRKATKTSEVYGKYTMGSTRVMFNDVLPDGSYTFSARHPNLGQSFLAVDAAWLLYPRLNTLQPGAASLEMNFPGADASRNFVIKTTPTTRVINTTDLACVYPHEVNYDAAAGTLTGSFAPIGEDDEGLCRLVAFDVTQPQRQVEFVAQIDNQNLHGTPTPDMVIITTATLLPAAENLAEIHRCHDGMEVLVVVQDKIFNEFSSATPDALAYRRLLKMFYDRQPEKIKYAVLYGPSIWDNRAITVAPADRLLCYETTNPDFSSVQTRCFVSDSFFGMTDDNVGYSNLINSPERVIVGRIPANLPADGFAVNRKIAARLAATPDPEVFSNVMFVTDDGDNNLYLRQAELIIDSMLVNRPSFTAVRAHNALYEWKNKDARDLRAVITSAFKRGVNYACFIGHNDDEFFGGERVWSKGNIEQVDYANPPLTMLSTCEAYILDNPNYSMAQKMLFKETGGAAAVVAAARTVYATSNQELAYAMGDEVSLAQPGTTLGQIWANARNRIVTSKAATNSMRINTLCYNFCGDPSLPLNVPVYKAAVTAVNNRMVNGADVDTLTLRALDKIRIEGYITDDNGVVSDFNGTVTLNLHQAPHEVETKSRGTHTADKVVSVFPDDEILVSRTVTVTNGKFTADIVSPVPVHEGGVNRLTLHARTDDGLLLADGCLACVSIVADSESMPGNVNYPAPVINYVAVNSPQTPDGAMVAANSTIVASGTVSELGLNTSSAIGAAPRLTVDGSTLVDNLRVSVDSETNVWSVSGDVANLSEGSHIATLTVADNVGQSATASVSFIVSGSADNIELSVAGNKAGSLVLLDIVSPLSAHNSLNLVVEDLFGKPVATFKDVTFPYQLDFTKLADGKLAEGYYDVCVQARGPEGPASSGTVRLTFVRR